MKPTILHRWKQQGWNEQLDITLLSNGVIEVDGVPVITPREKALANIILRFNAHTKALKEPLHLKIWKQGVHPS